MTVQEPVIEFNSYRLTNVDFKVYDNLDEILEKDIKHGELNASVGINEDFTDAQVKLRVSLIDEDNLRIISVEITGEFKINETDKEKAPKYLQINGTAILMPYLRSFISILTSLDNPEAVLLPTVNTNNFGDVENNR